MKIGSLFSGIGGFELGLEWAGLGHTLWQVEKDEKLRNCLAEHWPNAERFDDVREVGSHCLQSVDLICGGFPCQDVSSAGRRAGLGGSHSGLWFEFARIIEELHPRWVVVENVASGATKWVNAVRRGLARQGYESLPIPLSAADCGAWHERKRIFVVAYLDDSLRPRTERQVATDANGSEPRKPAEERKTPLLAAQISRNISDPHSIRELQPGRRIEQIGRWACNAPEIWASEPDVARMVHGLPGRVDRERALGNSVVPQCAQVIGEVIKLLAGSTGPAT